MTIFKRPDMPSWRLTEFTTNVEKIENAEQIRSMIHSDDPEIFEVGISYLRGHLGDGFSYIVRIVDIYGVHTLLDAVIPHDLPVGENEFRALVVLKDKLYGKTSPIFNILDDDTE